MKSPALQDAYVVPEVGPEPVSSVLAPDRRSTRMTEFAYGMVVLVVVVLFVATAV
jgi:hypothetical protein